MLYSIGEFSRITRLSVKTLRFYQDKGLLAPAQIDSESGYRYYRPDQIQDARRIAALKDLDLSLAEIAEILRSCEDDRDLIAILEAQKAKLNKRIRDYREAIRSMESLIKTEQQAMKETRNEYEVEEKQLEDQLVAGYRMRGRYDEMGKGFKVLGKAAGRHLKGTPLALYYCDEYQEEDADFEPCFPVKKEVRGEGIDCRTLPGGRALTLRHKGPYPTLGESYARLISAAKERGLTSILPSREVYIKGPGMIFKGNPENYITEIQFLVEATQP